MEKIINRRKLTGKTYRWYPAFTWSKGEYNKKSGDRFEIATSSSERNKANNIYDFAGNMWEWTTETIVYNLVYRIKKLYARFFVCK